MANMHMLMSVEMRRGLIVQSAELVNLSAKDIVECVSQERVVQGLVITVSFQETNDFLLAFDKRCSSERARERLDKI